MRSLDATFDEQTAILHVRGEVHEQVTPQLHQCLDEATAGGTRSVTVDLTGVTLLVSRAIGALVVANRTAGEHGQGVDLVARADTIAARVLDITGLKYRRA